MVYLCMLDAMLLRLRCDRSDGEELDLVQHLADPHGESHLSQIGEGMTEDQTSRNERQNTKSSYLMASTAHSKTCRKVSKRQESGATKACRENLKGFTLFTYCGNSFVRLR